MSLVVPPLTLLQAHSLAGFCATSYVGCLYVSQSTRISYSSDSAAEQAKERQRRRDDPDVIRARMVAVSLSTLFSCGLVTGVVRYLSTGEKYALGSIAEHLGFTASRHLLLPCLIAPVLYSGPFYVSFLSRTLPFQRFWSAERTLAPLVKTWVGWRNYILAPITEEVAFRACILAFYHMAGVSSQKLVYLSPLWFGLAHVHHGVETYHRLGGTRMALKNAILQVAAQLAYTTLFGFHCAYLFLKTGSIIPPIASHMFCNIMGLPAIVSDMACFPKKRISIMATHVLGVIGYAYALGVWTEGADSIYWTKQGQSATF